MYYRYFHFPQLLKVSSKVLVLIPLFIFFWFHSVVRRDSKVFNSSSCLFLLIIKRSGRLAEIRWSVCISKSQRSLCFSFSWIDSGLCIYHLFVRSNFYFLHNSLSTQSCLVLYSFCANWLHSFIMWLIALSLSPHNLHLLFCCVLSILALMWLVFRALFIIIIIIVVVVVVVVYSLRVFHTSITDGFPLEFEWQQVSWTFLSIQPDLSIALIWMVSTRPLI